jgi:hypothetical protein
MAFFQPAGLKASSRWWKRDSASDTTGPPPKQPSTPKVWKKPDDSHPSIPQPPDQCANPIGTNAERYIAVIKRTPNRRLL